MNTVTLTHGQPLALEEVLAVADGTARAALAPATVAMLAERRNNVMAYVAANSAPAYGFNRGFGHNVKEPVPPEDARTLQRNLILSHACGMGEPAPIEAVRAAMILRAHSLAQGHSGVRPAVVETLLACLNAGVVPVVPRLGSVSASGDLAPLSHIALGLIGLGDAHHQGRLRPAAEALRDAGIEPLVLHEKEGLALNNGVQYATAMGIIALRQAEVLLQTACIATALSTQVMLGADTPFRADLHALRPHPGAVQAARWLMALMANSPIRDAHRRFDVDGDIQDPYNIRCAPQILGACVDLLGRARQTFTIEANAVTDNPLLLAARSENGFGDAAWAGKCVDIVSGGHFHGMPIAVDLYGLIQACAILTRLSNMRCQRYVDESRNKGLGSDLRWPGPPEDGDTRTARAQATMSGMMIPEYVSAALTNWIWGACMPVHLLSIGMDAGQEDHVSMAANVGLRLLEILPRAADALALELAFAAQAAALRKQIPWVPSRFPWKSKHPWGEADRNLNPLGERVVAAIHETFPVVTADRHMAGELQALGRRVLQGDFARLGQEAGVFA